MSNRASLELTLGSPPKGRRKPPEEPLRVLFLADLSGRNAPEPTFKTHRVSYETFESTIVSVAPSAPIEISSPLTISETIAFSSIDDFHPDSLTRSLGVFRTLSILGDRLGDPNTRDEALTQLGELDGSDIPAEPREETLVAAEPQGEKEGDMMERLLGESVGASPRSRAHEKVEAFVQNVIDESQIEMPSVTAEVGQQQIAELMAATMRAVLMSQPLRTLERAWRSVEWLMQRLDNEAVEIHVVDLSKTSLSRTCRKTPDTWTGRHYTDCSVSHHPAIRGICLSVITRLHWIRVTCCCSLHWVPSPARPARHFSLTATLACAVVSRSSSWTRPGIGNYPMMRLDSSGPKFAHTLPHNRWAWPRPGSC